MDTDTPKKKGELHGFEKLRLTSSGSKILNQIIMFLVIGILPMVFPRYIHVENRNIVFVIVSSALATSLFFETLRIHLVNKGKNVNSLLNIQLFTSVILLTPFLFFFGRINGPFFVLYLLTVMESFLNQNIKLSYSIVTFMILAVTVEFGWLISIKEVSLSFIPIVGYFIRILSILFISAYGYVLATKMISEQKEHHQSQLYAEKLEELTEKLKAMDKQKDEFISMAAHELRAPMTAIKGYLSMIMEGDAGKVPEKICEFLRGSIEGNDRLIRLVNNMLNVGRIEEGRMVYQMGNVSLKDIINDTYNEFNGEAKAKDLVFELDIDKNITDKIYVDKDRIHEVITNLVSNAIKYTDKGSVLIKLSNPKVGTVRCEIVDSGRGITEEEQKKLFQKFGRAESSSGKTIGSGLGLYISKLLVEKFGGEIGLISESGKGSTFWFELPVV